MGVIEKNLILWIDNFKKQPFDALSENVKYLNEKDFAYCFGSSTKILGPVFALFCSIVHQSGLLEMGYDESNERYCERVCSHFSINTNYKKARQYFSKVMDIKEGDKYLVKVKELILPNISSEAEQIIRIYSKQ
ncbi:MAG: hypothetical protein IPP93_00650 [Chitinophagaceae bacterium]|nr:hypothetical protein [Chitinophagaceae bacterium]